MATSVRTAAATASATASFEVRAEAPIDIATDRCKGCELCIGICPKRVLELDLSVVNVLGHHPVRLLDGEACTSCALCARICPDAVFTIYRPRIA